MHGSASRGADQTQSRHQCHDALLDAQCPASLAAKFLANSVENLDCVHRRLRDRAPSQCLTPQEWEHGTRVDRERDMLSTVLGLT